MDEQGIKNIDTRHGSLGRMDELIHIVGMLAHKGFTIDAVMRAVVDRLPDLTDAESASIEIVDGEDLVCRAASRRLASHVGLRLARAKCLSGLSVATGQVLLSHDSESDPRVDVEACRKLAVRSMACAPLFSAGSAIGSLKIYGATSFRFNEDDVQALRLLAAVISAALTRQSLCSDGPPPCIGEGRAQRSEIARNALQVNDARMRNVMANALDAIVLMSESGAIIDWNRQAESLFGWTAREVVGRSVSEVIVPPRYREAHDAGLQRFVRTGVGPNINKRLELAAVKRSGEEFPAEISMNPIRLGERWEFIAFVNDISTRKGLEQALKDQAARDPLTGLLNRTSFMAALSESCKRATSGLSRSALLFLDLNQFKDINDVHGHHVGDKALQEFARRLEQSVRRSDVVARLGGDEFAVLSDGVATEGDGLTLRAHVTQALREPWICNQ